MIRYAIKNLKPLIIAVVVAFVLFLLGLHYVANNEEKEIDFENLKYK